MEDIYAEIGIRCPYLLAKHQGIKLITSPVDLGEICGIYKKSGRETYSILLNPGVDLESQEATVHLFIRHHNTELRGVQRCLMKNDPT